VAPVTNTFIKPSKINEAQGTRRQVKPFAARP
jgi:hypothetical protein